MRSCAVIEGVTAISTAARTHPPHRGGLAGQGTGLHSHASCDKKEPMTALAHSTLGRAPRALPKMSSIMGKNIFYSLIPFF